MRHPERIGRVLQKLELYWREHPDYRLGQIVSNANDIVRGRGRDIFHLEDDLLEDALHAMSCTDCWEELIKCRCQNGE